MMFTPALRTGPLVVSLVMFGTMTMTMMMIMMTTMPRPVWADAPARVTDQVYFDVEQDGKPLGRIVIGLFGKNRRACVSGAVWVCVCHLPYVCVCVCVCVRVLVGCLSSGMQRMCEPHRRRRCSTDGTQLSGTGRESKGILVVRSFVTGSGGEASAG